MAGHPPAILQTTEIVRKVYKVCKVLFYTDKLPPPTPPYTGGGMITKRFPLLCKEGLEGVVLVDELARHPFILFVDCEGNRMLFIATMRHFPLTG